MGKFRVTVGAGASDGGASVWSAAARSTVDDTSPARVEAVAPTPLPEPAAEFDVGLLRVGDSAVVAVRSRRLA